MPAHPVAQDLLRAAQMPLAAPSANRFGRISPTRAEHVLEELGDRIPYIIDGGPCDVGVESTVLAIDSGIQSNTSASVTITDTNEKPRLILLRPGKITASDIEHATSISVERASSTHEKASPGMLASHYAPRKNLYIIEDWSRLNASESAPWLNKKIGLLVTSGDGQIAQQALAAIQSKPSSTVCLSAHGLDSEAAQKLFAGMRELDNSEADVILATAAPNASGLWPAIADRLKRASTR
jgi:L-threonylcarbamoyladenylate synthase